MFLQILATLLILQTCYAPPVTKNKLEDTEPQRDGLEDYIEYHRYIREVVNALESDPVFREKLEKAKEEDIRSGKIAHELELVSHHVRTRLDEIKRTELQRLRDLMSKKKELLEGNSIEDPSHHHIDHANPHTFEIEDLKRLITKTTEDLAEADRRRREEFKQYELQKEYEKFEKLNHTTGDEREKLEKEFKELEEKHKKHEKLHAPGHKQQLEEVWEKQDHMQQDFNPKTFFMLHDLDSNGLWDQEEVKALFIKELDKLYQEGHPEDDMRERMEEMERMREMVFTEMDRNRDGFIDFDEFLEQTKRNDFEKDTGYQPLDEQKPYTDEELDAYIRQHQLQYGAVHPNAYYGQGYNMPPPAYQGYPQQGYDPNYPNGQMHPGQVPPHPGQYNQHPGQAYQGPQYHGQVSPQHPGQVPPQYPGQGSPQRPGQVPPQHPGQVPPQHPGQVSPQHPGQVLPQHPGQVPPQHPGQVPPPHPGQVPQNSQPPTNQENQPPLLQPSSQNQQQNIQTGAGQFQPGQLPQAQIQPQHMPSNAAPNLNTNEVYPNQVHQQPQVLHEKPSNSPINNQNLNQGVHNIEKPSQQVPVANQV